MARKEFRIEGMSCQHCIMRVKKAVDQIPGVSSADVTLGSAAVEYDGTKAKAEDLRAAIEKAGYKVAS